MKLEKDEIKDIIIAWIAISLCFALVLGNYNLINLIRGSINFNLLNLIKLLGLSLIVTGTSFIFHELAHKYTAIYFGAKSRFIMWKHYLFGALIFSAVFGFVFIAPGAVYIFGKRLSIKQNGIVSLAGPLSNIILAILFFIVAILPFNIPRIIIAYGIHINLWIAFFNLLPIGPLDGKKIMAWNPFIWGLFIAIPVFFLFL